MSGKVKLLFSFLLVIILVQSCENDRRTIRTEQKEIQDYIASHPEYNFVETGSGLYYADIVVGDGAAPEAFDYVSVRYTGTFLDGTVFDTNANMDDDGNYTSSVLKFYLNNGTMIKGFDEGVSYMKLGGEAIMILPSEIGYGNNKR
jgi:FKBP-type peptidyl-prolyl cis-trans isomerase